MNTARIYISKINDLLKEMEEELFVAESHYQFVTHHDDPEYFGSLVGEINTYRYCIKRLKEILE